MKKIPVGVLGATGTVGQRFIEMLEMHPWFELTALAASERSAGKSYEEALDNRWKISGDIPGYAKDMQVQRCEPGLDCELVFSALDSSVAGPIEQAFAKAGYAVSSNSKNHRMEPDVPLLIPEVNPGHLEAVKEQKKRGWKGFIVTNPNCSTIHLVLALKPLHDSFTVKKVNVVTMQALSGAGYPGVPSFDIIDNVVPYIGGEEPKMEEETAKLLGTYDRSFRYANIGVSATCNRVNVKDGHLEAVSVELADKPTKEDFAKAFKEFSALPQQLGLPTAPKRPIVVRDEPDRPQPRLDRDAEQGMASVVGRIRDCNVLHYKFMVLGHNTVRGAAGAALLNAELMLKKDLI